MICPVTSAMVRKHLLGKADKRRTRVAASSVTRSISASVKRAERVYGARSSSPEVMIQDANLRIAELTRGIRHVGSQGELDAIRYQTGKLRDQIDSIRNGMRLAIARKLQARLAPQFLETLRGNSNREIPGGYGFSNQISDVSGNVQT